LAQPSFVAAGAFTAGTGALSVPWPAGYQDGDYALLAINHASFNGDAVSGWTFHNAASNVVTPDVAGAVTLRLFGKDVAGTQSNVAVSDAGSYTTAQIFVFRDAAGPAVWYEDSGSHVLEPATDYIETTAVATAGDPFPAGSLVASFIGLDKDATQTNTITGTLVSNFGQQVNLVKRADSSTSLGAGGGIALITGELSSALTDTGPVLSTADSSTNRAYVTIVLRTLSPDIFATVTASSSTAAILSTAIRFAATPASFASVSAFIEERFPDASWGVVAVATASADLTTDPFLWLASISSEASAIALRLSASEVVLSDVVPAGWFYGAESVIAGQRRLYADTLGSTTVLCGYTVVNNYPSTEMALQTSALVFNSDSGQYAVMQLAAGYWGNVRAVNDSLYVLVRGGSLNVTQVHGYRANNSDAVYFQAGNFHTLTLPFAAKWSDLAYGSNIYVAVAPYISGVATNQYATSIDRINWTIRTLPVSGISQCCFVGNRFVINGYTSTDGISWSTGRSFLGNMRLSGGVLFSDEDTAAHRTLDGITWYPNTSGVETCNVAYVPTQHGGVHVLHPLVPLFSYSNLRVSNDNGATWVSPPNELLRDITAGGGAVYPAKNSVRIAGYLVSTLSLYIGGTWVNYLQDTWSMPIDYTVNGGSWCNSRSSTSLNPLQQPAVVLQASVACSSDLRVETLLYARPGLEWGVRFGETWAPKAISGNLAVTRNALLIGGVGSTVYAHSPDVNTLVSGAYTAPTVIDNEWFGYCSQLFIGHSGPVISYSLDGKTWVATYTHSADVYVIKYLNGEYYAISFDSTAAAKSPDGITWTPFTGPAVWYTSLFFSKGAYYWCKYVAYYNRFDYYRCPVSTFPSGGSIFYWTNIPIDNVLETVSGEVVCFDLARLHSSDGFLTSTLSSVAPHLYDVKLIRGESPTDGFLGLRTTGGMVYKSDDATNWEDTGLISPYGVVAVNDGWMANSGLRFFTSQGTGTRVTTFAFGRGSKALARLTDAIDGVAVRVTDEASTLATLTVLGARLVGAVSGVSATSSGLSTEILVGASITASATTSGTLGVSFSIQLQAVSSASAAMSTAIRLVAQTSCTSLSVLRTTTLLLAPSKAYGYSWSQMSLTTQIRLYGAFSALANARAKLSTMQSVDGAVHSSAVAIGFLQTSTPLPTAAAGGFAITTADMLCGITLGGSSIVAASARAPTIMVPKPLEANCVSQSTLSALNLYFPKVMLATSFAQSAVVGVLTHWAALSSQVNASTSVRGSVLTGIPILAECFARSSPTAELTARARFYARPSAVSYLNGEITSGIHVRGLTLAECSFTGALYVPAEHSSAQLTIAQRKPTVVLHR